MKEHYNCPVQATINAIAGKWKVQIVWHLSFGTLGFAQLRRKLKTVSEKVLTAQLRQLESDGIVTRTVRATNPPHVDYALTASGRELVAPMQQLCDWGSKQFGIKGTLPQPKGRVGAPAGVRCAEDE
ncbi:winged helix-turn-helix transcriptional regulator [Frigoriglobus tundricola]|uniref:Transcriptional regulator, HxlR family n=1 Tax=Frigoriglobus tundricola TaxID=2774151 RepID=A0A6M5YRU7_9BACT|nr:helix-turn-helix domain-containing protein [Frigoriglobus tundricola]QJW96807.1 Transcriptional regulator, HxlR family [Frigoriglobus tundricola]